MVSIKSTKIRVSSLAHFISQNCDNFNKVLNRLARHQNKKKICVNNGQTEMSVCLRRIESIWNVVIELEIRNDAFTLRHAIKII